MALSRKCSLALLLSILVAHCMPISADDALDQSEFSSEELKQAYESYSGDDKRVLDSWTPEQRRATLRQKALFFRMQKEASSQPTPAAQPVQPRATLYRVDPLLRRAMEAYMDEEQPREVAIGLFEQYMAANPSSEFLPEINYRLGALYTVHRRKGEPRRRVLAGEYFWKSHELYGARFSYLHDHAWASFTNYPEATLELRKDYYDWLLAIQQNLGEAVIHPVREIEQTFNGRPPTRSEGDKRAMAHALGKNLPRTISAAEDNILSRAGRNYGQLADLAKSYPDTRLGRLADERLTAIDWSDKGAVSVMDSEAFLAKAATVEQPASTRGAATTSAGQPVSGSLDRSAANRSGNTWERLAKYTLLAAMLLAAAIAIWSVWRRRSQARS